MTDFPQNPHGSRQLRVYRNARRAGLDQAKAVEIAGISIGEARLIDVEDAKSPPPPQAYEDPPAPGLGAINAENPDTPVHDDPNAPGEELDPLIELTSETLRGDIRDSLLDWFKAQPKAWPFLSEREQRDLADATDRYARQLIKSAAKLIAAGERPTIVAKLVEYKEKDGVEAKLKLPSTGECVASLHEACGREVLLVTSGAEDFMEEGGPPKIDADQPPIPGIGEEYDEAA